MHKEAFTLFPATVINADTPTDAFDCANFDAFMCRMTLSGLGTSQGCRPLLQALMPDGTTWVTIAATTTQQTTNSSFLYQFGRATAAGGGQVTETINIGVPRICRLLLDVVNANDCTAKIEMLPIQAI